MSATTPTKSNAMLVVLVVGMLITGSINTLAKKMGYNTCSRGLSGVDVTEGAMDGCPPGEHKFQKVCMDSLSTDSTDIATKSRRRRPQLPPPPGCCYGY